MSLYWDQLSFPPAAGWEEGDDSKTWCICNVLALAKTIDYNTLCYPHGNPHEGGVVITPIIQMRKLSHRAVTCSGFHNALLWISPKPYAMTSNLEMEEYTGSRGE